MLSGLGIGRIVGYVLKGDDLPGTHQSRAGQIIPAIVVNDWPQLNRDDGYANLTGFPDWTNQGIPEGILWLASRTYDAGRAPGSWHWLTGSTAAIAANQPEAPPREPSVETHVETGRCVSVSRSDEPTPEAVPEPAPVV